MKSPLALSLSLLPLASAASLPQHLSPRTCSFDRRAAPLASSQTSSPLLSSRSLNTTTWNPPSNLIKPLQEVWDHEMATYSNPLGFKNYGYDQVIAAAGKINYCVRWESAASVTAAQRAKVETAIQRSFKKWVDVLKGFEGWPYDSVEVKVVGWAVKSKGLLLGDTSGVQVYTGLDAAGAPQCDEGCGRFFHQNADYSKCAAGAARHYDLSLWLTSGFNGGAGGDWGQRVASEYFMQNLDTENIHIVLHELGHTFALDDFYDWTPTGVENFIMKAGSATQITEFDAWMARDWWRHLKSRYGL